jgi:hypothetical protein
MDNLAERISNWPELASLIEYFSYLAGYPWLFRGTLDARHKLIPKIEREARPVETSNEVTE